MVKLERCNWPRSLDPERLIAIRKNLENAFRFDYNVIIEEYDFYEHLSPQLRTKLVTELFGPFESKFELFFGELERLFINEVIINMFARIYKPNDVILFPGQPVPSVMFVMKGHLAVCEPNGNPFCILGEGSVLGEF